MYPGTFAETTPDKPATIMAGSGRTQTFKELDDRSSQLAQLLWDAGLRRGDHVAIFMENSLEYMECYWAATRSGLYFTTINRYLQADEAAYILQDSNSKALFTSARMAELASELPGLVPELQILLSVDGGVDGFEDYETALARYPAERLEHQPRGEIMLYSSGTTGRPKGIKRPLVDLEVDDPAGMTSISLLLTGLFGVDPNSDTVYLSPAPMYHTAPLAFCAAMQGQGATVVVMERFDAAEALKYLEQYKITHSQWVPTMFSRMLKLPEEQRTGYLQQHPCLS
ncbi:MAG: AMP-binding protein [Actinomycetota bacterium]